MVSTYSLHEATIHQPDFLPWMGLFNKVMRCEKLVFFDTVQISTGKGWSSRVKILLNNNEYWLTMPIIKSGKSYQKIYQVEMQEYERNWQKILKTIRQAYLKTPHFNTVFEWLSNIDFSSCDNKLSEFNIIFMVEACKLLGYKGEFLKCSDHAQLRESEKLQTEYIVEVANYFGIKDYLSGEGCLDFLEVKMFSDSDIKISFQGFKHPQYKQYRNPEFMPGLSVIDSLMNNGVENTRDLILTHGE